MPLPHLAVRRVSATAWAMFLAIALIVAATAAYRHTQDVKEYPLGCDSFGYLRMARQVRSASASPLHADFHLHYSQTKHLIAALQESHIPVSQWDEVVAPHAHHYFPSANAVGPQYPPGTAILLAAFPEGKAVRDLSAFDLGVLLTIGLTLVVRATWKGAWLAAGMISVATVAGFDYLADVGASSFSINAMSVPVFLAVLFAFGSSSCQNRWFRGLFAIAAGASLGFAVLVRLPIILLAPGLLTLVLPQSVRDIRSRRVIGEPALWFVVALVNFGVVPLLWHQQRVAGAWHLSTYGTGDSASPSFACVPENAWYYLTQPGLGGFGSWMVLAFAIGLLFALRTFHSTGECRLIAAALITWGVPAAYFLTHSVTTHYYAIPSMFATLWLLALGVWKIESTACSKGIAPRQSTRRLLAIGVGAILIGQATHLRWTAPTDVPRSASPPSMPAELHDGKPWIWADMTSGTITYYIDVPTFKISFGNRETRQRVYAIAFATGERQFLVVDCPSMVAAMAEIQLMGGTLEPRGQVATFPYYLIHWPQSGPIGP